MQPFILVVDDDPNIATLVTESLENKGYRVTFCNDAAQAVIQAEGTKIGLLIMDIMMPGFGSGIDAYINLRKNRSLSKELPIIFLTGVKPEQAGRLIPKDDPRVRLLHKPTTMTKLQTAIRELTGDSLLPAKSQRREQR